MNRAWRCPTVRIAYWRELFPARSIRPCPGAARRRRRRVLVDGNVLAKATVFRVRRSRIHSPDHRFFAYTFDESGSESYTLMVRIWRPDAICRSRQGGFASPGPTATHLLLGLDDEFRSLLSIASPWNRSADDALVYEEQDLQFSVSVDRTRSGRFIVIFAASSDTAKNGSSRPRPESEPRLVQPRVAELMYSVDDCGDQLSPDQRRRRRRLQDRDRAG